MQISQPSKSKTGKSTPHTRAAIAAFFVSVLLLGSCDSASRDVPMPTPEAVATAKFMAATINTGSPSSLVLAFTAAVEIENARNSNTPDFSVFILDGSKKATAVTGVSGSGTKTLTLALNGPAAQGEDVKLTYVGENIKTNITMNKVTPFEGVAKNNAPDTVAPTLVRAVIVGGAPGSLVLVFSEAIKPGFALGSGAALGFSVTGAPVVAGAPCTLNGATLTLPLYPEAIERQPVYLSYFGTVIKDIAGNELAEINNRVVNNGLFPWYEITLDWGGSSGDGAEGSLFASQGTSLNLPVAGVGNNKAKIGYDHTGWANGSATTSNGAPYTPAGNVTVTAVWTPAVYNIVYSNVDAANNTNLLNYTIDTPTIQLVPPTAPSGMDFSRWKDVSGNTVEQITLGSTGNRVILAEWKFTGQSASSTDNSLLTLAALFPDSAYYGGAANLASIPGSHLNIGFANATLNYTIHIPPSRLEVLLVARPASTKSSVEVYVNSQRESGGEGGEDVYYTAVRSLTGNKVVAFKVTAESGEVKTYIVTVGIVNPSAYLSGTTEIIAFKPNDGYGGTPANAAITVTLANATVRAALTDETDNVSSWFAPTVAGLTYTATAAPGDTTINIVVAGTPMAISSVTGQVTIAQGALSDTADTEAGAVAAGIVNYKIFEASAAVSAILGGTTEITGTQANNEYGGVAVSAEIDITLVNATVRTALTGTSNNVSSWFGTTVAGLTYTATAAVGADTINIVVSGPPTGISSAAGVQVTIPANALSDTNSDAVGSPTIATGTVSYAIGLSAALPSASLSGTTAITATQANNGYGGVAASAAMTITLTDATVLETFTGRNVSSWFGTIVTDLSYTASAGANTINIVVVGPPGGISSAAGVQVTIPANTLADTKGAAFGSATIASGMVSYNIGLAATPPAASLGGTTTINATTKTDGIFIGKAANATITITLANANVGSAWTNRTVPSWFGTTVAGLTYSATSSVGSETITIAVTGIPTGISSAAGVQVKIPGTSSLITDGNGVTVTSDIIASDTVSYNIDVIKRTTASIKNTFRITTDGTTGVSDAFNAVHDYVSDKTAAQLSALNYILLGDYIDLEGGITVGSTHVDDAEISGHGRRLRLIVVGINSFNSSGSYTSPNTACAHLVFQFQNIPFDCIMTDNVATGYRYSTNSVRDYLLTHFLPGLNTAGLPAGVLWGPTRTMGYKSGNTWTTESCTDTLWLPTEREMSGINQYSPTNETSANQARLEYYTNDDRRNKRGGVYQQNYWLASPSTAMSDSNTATHCAVGWYGILGLMVYGEATGVAPAFCVR